MRRVVPRCLTVATGWCSPRASGAPQREERAPQREERTLPKREAAPAAAAPAEDDGFTTVVKGWKKKGRR